MTTTAAPTTATKYPGFDANRRPISKEWPRLLGSRERLRELAQQRPDAYRRMLEQARLPFDSNTYAIQAKIIGLGIAYVLEGSRKEGREIVDLVLREYIDKPIKSGHVTFAYDLARCALAYDLCHDLWTADERQRFSKYTHATIAANHESEPSVFHNGWYGYKHWGYGMAGYALMHDDPEAGSILKYLEEAYLRDAVPALKFAGGGGGWAEGYYIHYWLFDWMFFCEVARWVEGVDYYAPAPEFFNQRAIAAMFESFPPLMPPTSIPSIDGNPAVTAAELSRRPIPMGDGGGKFVKHERDKTLCAQRILTMRNREEPAHQAVQAFIRQTPKPAIPVHAFMDFFWDDPSVKAGDLDAFKLSHLSAGPGYVYARSSWKQDATHFFFKCGGRFTAHQHLDNGHFMIFKHDELLSDGGHYAGWTESHIVNYYIRSIAHNTLLIEDPSEKWELVRGQDAENDGGQYFPHRPGRTTHHNGGTWDVPRWEASRDLLETGRITAFRDAGSYLYTAGDFTKSYSANKAKCVTRQIVFLRPGTFVIFDRVESTNPAFKKKFVLQPMSVPEKRGEHYVVTQGKGRLFIQTLMPAETTTQLYHGETLYTYGGKTFTPRIDFNRAPDCRMEVTATTPATFDCFLHVLTATDAGVESVKAASAKREGNEMVVNVDGATIRFKVDRDGGKIAIGGKEESLA